MKGIWKRVVHEETVVPKKMAETLKIKFLIATWKNFEIQTFTQLILFNVPNLKPLVKPIDNSLRVLRNSLFYNGF